MPVTPLARSEIRLGRLAEGSNLDQLAGAGAAVALAGAVLAVLAVVVGGAG